MTITLSEAPDYLLHELWFSGQIPTDRYEDEIARRLEQSIEREVIHVDFTPERRVHHG